MPSNSIITLFYHRAILPSVKYFSTPSIYVSYKKKLHYVQLYIDQLVWRTKLDIRLARSLNGFSVLFLLDFIQKLIDIE